MPGFKLYEVKGYPEPVRLSPDHAEALNAKEVGSETDTAADVSKSTSKSSSKS